MRSVSCQEGAGERFLISHVRFVSRFFGSLHTSRVTYMSRMSLELYTTIVDPFDGVPLDTTPWRWHLKEARKNGTVFVQGTWPNATCEPDTSQGSFPSYSHDLK